MKTGRLTSWMLGCLVAVTFLGSAWITPGAHAHDLDHCPYIVHPYAGGPGDGPPEAFAFREELEGYGSWRYVSSVGGWLWFPYVELDWRPYLLGHWILTSYGMTWVAYEPWGSIPHHYGRWVYVDRYGWGWVPGFTYGPAWVTWAVVDGYVGWAPLPPEGYRYPRYRTYAHRGLVHYPYERLHDYHPSGMDFSLWVFVSNRHFYGTNIYVHILPTHRCLDFFRVRRVLHIGPRIDVSYVRTITPTPIRNVEVVPRRFRFGERQVVHYEPRGQEYRVQKAKTTVERVVRSTRVREKKEGTSLRLTPVGNETKRKRDTSVAETRTTSSKKNATYSRGKSDSEREKDKTRSTTKTSTRSRSAGSSRKKSR